MPLFVTDTDVLQQIALNDAEASTVDSQMTSLGSKVPSQTSTAWATDLAAYRTWAGAAKTRLSGGFISGEWFGVVSDGNAAEAWKELLDQYQAILTTVAAGGTPAAPVPALSSTSSVSDANTQGIVTGTTAAASTLADSLEGPVGLAALGAVGLAVLAFILIKRT